MKRNIFITICEIFSPMILMFLVYVLRTAFKIEYIMGDDEDYDSDLLGELNVYDEISKQPNRKNCALLPYKAVVKMLGELEGYGK